MPLMLIGNFVIHFFIARENNGFYAWYNIVQFIKSGFLWSDHDILQWINMPGAALFRGN